MTYDLFWHGDATLVRAYREAEEIRKNRRNQEMWWQGMYIYEAICNAAPLIRTSFGKKVVKPLPYPKEPYDIRPKKARTEEAEHKEEQKLMEKGKRTMEAWMASVNAKRRQKQQEGGTQDVRIGDH